MGIAADLRRLRESARPKLSIRAMADQLGMSAPTYHRYESEKGFKQRYLPMDLARRIARILADRGINPDDVLALAGIQPGEGSGPNLSVGEERLLDLFRVLGADRRQLLLDVASAFADGPPFGATIHSTKPAYRARG